MHDVQHAMHLIAALLTCRGAYSTGAGWLRLAHAVAAEPTHVSNIQRRTERLSRCHSA